MKLNLAIIFFLINLSVYSQTNYYVSNTGTGDTLNTLSEITALTLQPGDSVLFKCDDAWYSENFLIGESGSIGSHIIFSSYGTGDKPKLYGARPITSWTALPGNIWVNDSYSDYTGIGGALASMFISITGSTDKYGRDSIQWGTLNVSQDTANLDSEYEWTYTSGSNTIYVYYSGDPNSDWDYAMPPSVTNIIEIQHKDYITINNIEMAYSSLSCIRDSYPMIHQKGFTLTNCYLHHVGYKGSNTAYGVYLSHSDAYYGYNEIHDMGRRGLSLSILDGAFDDARMENVIIEHNHFHHGWHTTGIDCIIGDNDIVDSMVIRYNYFEGSPEVDLTNEENSNHIFLSNKAKDVPGDTSSWTRAYIYNNVFTYPHGKAVMLENVDDSYIVFNTFYKINQSTTNGQSIISLSASSENDTVYNNVFFNDDDLTIVPGYDFITLNVTAAGLRSNTHIDYNLHYTTDINNRLLSTPDSTTFGYWIHSYTEWGDYQSSLLYEQNSLFNGSDLSETKPIFADTNSLIPDFNLIVSSPGISSAVPIFEFVTDDYEGKPRSATTPTVGAFEYVEVSEEIGTRLIVNRIWRSFNVNDNKLIITAPINKKKTIRTPVIF